MHTSRYFLYLTHLTVISDLEETWLFYNKMAMCSEQDFNRSALTVKFNWAWYTGQQAERIPAGLVGLIGPDCSGLDLSYNNLSSVTGLRDFSHLEELVLDNNSLRDLNTLPRMPSLTTLSLNNNKLADIESVLERITACCPSLKYVSLLGNPGCPDQLTDPSSTDEADYERYRRYAVYVLPDSLTFLDSRTITPRERREARERGRLMKTVKVNLPNVDSLTSEEFAAAVEGQRLKQKSGSSAFGSRGNDESDYTPLPKSSRGPSEIKSAYGKCRYRYSGKNSEGNRFISNNDL